MSTCKEVVNDMALFFEPFAPLLELSRERWLAGDRSPFVPPADVVVTDDDVTVVMDVPGLKADDLMIELREDVLTVRGARAFPYDAEADEAGRVRRRLERGFGEFERVLRVPAGLDPDAITASMSDGVLSLHIPKPEARKPKRIEIETGQKAAAIEGAATEQRELAGSSA